MFNRVKVMFKQSSRQKTLLAWWSDGGMLSGRTLHGIGKQFYGSMVKVKAGAKVITIEPAQNALTIEWVVELFRMAFEHVCAMKEVDRKPSWL